MASAATGAATDDEAEHARGNAPRREHDAPVIALAAVSRGDAARVGGKAANLGELMRAGFAVPDGVVVTCDALARSPSPRELAPDVERAIRDAVTAHFRDRAVAVRSSAVGEDGAEASFAGQFETLLDVRGADAIIAAVNACRASALAPRAVDYAARTRVAVDAPRMAVVVQAMVRADCAGVAFTANPVTGARGEALVSAVRGVGERLVSGTADAEEWRVRGAQAPELVRGTGDVLHADIVLRVAALARRIEEHFGAPQDVEWACHGDAVYALQARPITALPDVVEWSTALPGGWLRNFRLGEWLPGPVTPLFESWLLRALEEGLNDFYFANSGVRAPPPNHITLHGWYFASMNFAPTNPLAMLGQMLLGVLPRMLTKGRRALSVLPPAHALCIELFVGDWRAHAARCKSAVDEAAGAIEGMETSEAMAVVDRLAALAGWTFGMISMVSGYAWKVEIPLASFWRAVVAPLLGDDAGSHQQLLQGLFVPMRHDHDVESLDWAHPTAGELAAHVPASAGDGDTRRAALERRRLALEERARSVLSVKQRASFDALLARAQRFARIRDEQTSQLTIAWPTMRRALLRAGETLVAAGALAAREDVFFLTRDELHAAVAVTAGKQSYDIAARRRRHEANARLTPPLSIGTVPALVQGLLDEADRAFRVEVAAQDALVRGMPASPGRASGTVIVVRSLDDFARVRDGDVLVARATMPAWTPLFARVAAVVTDIGSVVAHAALVAREYGIPAVVGTGDATTTLRDGDRVVVDGTCGVVTRASDAEIAAARAPSS